MPAPPNTTAALAADLGSLPATITPLDVSGATGPNYDVWYKYTAVAPEIIISVYAHATGAYVPNLTVWTGTPPGVVAYLTTIDTFNTPAQVPVTAGTTYYFRIRQQNVAVPNANLQLAAETGPATITAGKHLLITDADVGFPAAVIKPGSDAVESFQLLAASDWGARLPTGELGFQNQASKTTFLIYSAAYVLLHTVASQFNNQSTLQQVAASLTYFYTGKSTNAVAATVHQVAADGTVSATSWTLPANSKSLKALGPTNDDTVLYYAALFTNSSIVYAWDLVNSVALPNLVGARSGFAGLHDLIVLADDTILCPFSGASAGQRVERYDSAGTLLNTYTFDPTMEIDRLGKDPDDASTFWVWLYVTSDQFTSRLQQIQVSDGAVLSSTDVPIFLGGVYQDDTDTDPPLCGTSNTCPLIVIPGTSTTTYTIRRQRRFLAPSSPDNKTMQMPVLELLMRTGIGLTPTDSWGGSLPLGVDPQVMIRVSRDGGKTWGPERWVSAGRLGKFADRVRLTRFSGNYRNLVIEVTVDAPVDWGFLAAIAPNGMTEGNS